VIALALRGGWSFGLQELFDFNGAEGFRHALPAAGQGKIFRQVGVDFLFLFGKAIKSAEGSDLEVDTLAAEAAGGVLRLAGELALAFMGQEAHEVVELDGAPVGDVLFFSPVNEPG